MLLFASTSLTAFAANTNSAPVDILTSVIGKSAEEIAASLQEGKSYGAIAAEEGKLTEFHAAMLTAQKDALAAAVANKTITQEEADAQLANLEARMTLCDGTGNCQNGTGICQSGSAACLNGTANCPNGTGQCITGSAGTSGNGNVGHRNGGHGNGRHGNGGCRR